MTFDAIGSDSYAPTYEPFIPLPGATTILVAIIVIALVLWAKKRDEKHPRDTDES